MASSILYQDVGKTVTILDIPRSIELAQGFSSENDCRRLISSKPIEQAYPSGAPKSAKAKARASSPSIEDLLLGKYIQFALRDVKSVYKGPWYYPRALEYRVSFDNIRGCHLNKSADEVPQNGQSSVEPVCPETLQNTKVHAHDQNIVHYNTEAVQGQVQMGISASLTYIPPLSSFLQGTIEATRDAFISKAPKFDLVIMDPPWPNRSARRKNSYDLSNNTREITSLLSLLPLHSHLADDALVGVWVTNKPAFRDLLIEPNGFFDRWGLKVAEEWVWLKVTGSGDPIFALDSTGRKPYEILLLGRKSVTDIRKARNIERKIIIAVPDMHSRKPNLQELLEPMLFPRYHALEIFSRYLTAGWWAWGNEVLQFQGAEHWTRGDIGS